MACMCRVIAHCNTVNLTNEEFSLSKIYANPIPVHTN